MNVKFPFNFDRLIYYLGHTVRLFRSARSLWRGLACDVVIFRKGGKAK